MNQLTISPLPVSPAEAFRYTPPTYPEGQDGPVYLLKVGSLTERAAFRRELLALGADYPGDAALYAEMRRCVEALEPENAADLLALIDRAENEPKDGGDVATALLDAERRSVAELERILVQNFPAYADLVARRSFYMEVLPIVAARMFLLGVEEAGFSLTRRGPVMPDTELRKVPPADLEFIGYRIHALLFPQRDQEKN